MGIMVFYLRGMVGLSGYSFNFIVEDVIVNLDLSLKMIIVIGICFFIVLILL